MLTETNLRDKYHTRVKGGRGQEHNSSLSFEATLENKVQLHSERF